MDEKPPVLLERVFCLLLFLIGCFWAWFCIAILLFPFAMLVFTGEALISQSIAWTNLFLLLFILLVTILMAFNAFIGYRIWAGWIYFSLKGSYRKDGSGRSFWYLSIWHHLAWIVLMPLFVIIMEFEENSFNDGVPTLLIICLCYMIWPAFLCLFSLVCFFYYKKELDDFIMVPK